MLPFISVIIPTRNRPQALARCVRALRRLDYPADCHEIVIVNDGGVLPHASVFADSAGSCPLSALSQRHAGPARARNYGAQHACGEWLAFSDDDCTVSGDWLKVLSQRFGASPGRGVVGRTINDTEDDQFAAASEVVLEYFGRLEWNAWGLSRLPTTENLALPADRFRAIGGFDESFELAGGEDRDFCDRWLQRGWALDYAEAARVFRVPQPGLGPFLGRHFRYGRGAYRFSQLRSRRGGARVSARGMALYWGLLRCAKVSTPTSRTRVAALVAASQLMTACGFLWQSAQANRRPAPFEFPAPASMTNGVKDV